MYDMHYDLLTILSAYCNKIDDNLNLDDLLTSLLRLYSHDNVIGGIVHLSFKNPSLLQRKRFRHDIEDFDVSVLFKKSLTFLENMQLLGCIPEKIDFIYGIEDIRFIKGVGELESLYNNGLRVIAPVCSEDKVSLNEIEKEVIDKAMDFGMIIDISNLGRDGYSFVLEKVQERKENGLDSFVIASHTRYPDNLTSEELVGLKDAGGYISLFTNGNFVPYIEKQVGYLDARKHFLEHMDYIKNEIGFNDDKILLASDEEDFQISSTHRHLDVFSGNQIKKQAEELFSKEYGYTFASKVLFQNARHLFEKVKQKGKRY